MAVVEEEKEEEGEAEIERKEKTALIAVLARSHINAL